MQPDQARRRFSRRGERAVLWDKLNLPIGRGGLADNDGQRRFGELDERAPVGTGRQLQLTGQFRSALAGFPYRLAFAQFPAWFREIYRWQGSGVAAGQENQRNQAQG